MGSIPRRRQLLEGLQESAAGRLGADRLDSLYTEAVRDTIERFEATGSPVITDGEQSKPSFATYPIHGLGSLAPDGVVIPFADGHIRQLPRLTTGPFRYQVHADQYLEVAKRYAHVPVKQAVIAASALSLLYPQNGIDRYPRDAFLDDLVNEAEADIRGCLEKGAHVVQIDFTEGRLSVKLDPSKGLLNAFVELNNRVLDPFTPEERRRIGVHTCPGGDQDSTHSLDVDYGELLPTLFTLRAHNFYIQMASEADRGRVLSIIRDNSRDDQTIFVGVIDPINPRVETPEEVRDRVLEAAEYIAPERLGTCDDCGFSPFGDDVSTSRETAFEKIRARVAGTSLAAKKMGSRWPVAEAGGYTEARLSCPLSTPGRQRDLRSRPHRVLLDEVPPGQAVNGADADVAPHVLPRPPAPDPPAADPGRRRGGGGCRDGYGGGRPVLVVAVPARNAVLSGDLPVSQLWSVARAPEATIGLTAAATAEVRPTRADEPWPSLGNGMVARRV